MQSIDIHQIIERIAGDGMSLNDAPHPAQPIRTMPTSAVSDSKLTARNESRSTITNAPSQRQMNAGGGGGAQQRNYTFSAMRMRDIERNNHILVQRIVNTKASASVRQSFSCTNLQQQQQRRSAIVPSALVNRRKQQQLIDSGNMRLQRRLMEIASKKSATTNTNIGRPPAMR